MEQLAKREFEDYIYMGIKKSSIHDMKIGKLAILLIEKGVV